MKIIIFEGHDRAGKSSIAIELAKITRFQYFKSHQQKNHFKNNEFLLSLKYETNYFLDLLQQVNFKGDGLIIDRHIPSEFVYSMVFQRETDIEYITEIDKILANQGAIIIYCSKDFTSKKYDDELIDFKYVDNLKKYYEDYLKLTKMKYLKLNTTDENLENQIKQILEFIGKN